MAGKATRAHGRDPVMELLTSARLAVGCFEEGEPVVGHDEIDKRFARLSAAVAGAPVYSAGEWDGEVWAALLAVARLTAGVPRNWRGRSVRILSETLDIALRLTPDVRQRAMEGIPDDELPYHLRG